MNIITSLSIVLLLHFVACEENILTQWKQWKAEYHKTYSQNEDEKKFNIWKDNFEIVQEHNKLYERGSSTYKMGMTSLAAMTKVEFQAMLMDHRFSIFQTDASYMAYFKDGSKSLPATVAWENTNYVTPVKNQGQIGSCYSFSAVEAVEGQFSKQTGTLVSFSEQQIVDCNQGGDGGFPFMVYPYLIQCGGLQTESAYPYEGQVDDSCHFNANKAVATVKSLRFVVPLTDENALKQAVAEIGPISVSSIKVFPSFQLYKSGVYYEPLCESPDLNGDGYHAMLATGYGTTSDGKDYWMVKNSWGTGWGENGYIQMARNKRNNCGIASQATYPIMTANQTKSSNLGATGDGDDGFTVSPSVFMTLFLSCFAVAMRRS